MTIEQIMPPLVIIVIILSFIIQNSLYKETNYTKKNIHESIPKNDVNNAAEEEPETPNTSGQVYAKIDNMMYYISYSYKDVNDLLSIANRNINLEAMFGYEDLTGKSSVGIYMNSAYIGIQTYEHRSLNIAIIRQCLGSLAIQLGYGSAYYGSAADAYYIYHDYADDIDDTSNNDNNENVIDVEQQNINVVNDIDTMNANTEKNTKQRSITIL